MRNLIELGRSNVGVFKLSDVGNYKPLEDSLDLVETSPRLLMEKFYSYYKVVKGIFNLSAEELTIIKAVNEQLNSKRGADEFVEVMGKQKEEFLGYFRTIGDINNPNNVLGISELTQMMTNAMLLKQYEPDWKPKDGDPKADNVIWGFVRGAVDPEIDIDFSICHGIERTLTSYYPNVEYARHKDWLLCAMNDVVALKGLRGDANEVELFPMWSKARPYGLGWISQRRVDAYKGLI